MSTTPKQIQDACGNIETCLKNFAADNERIFDLQRALAALQWLRQQYAADKALVEPFLQQLKHYSQQIAQIIAAAREALTNDFLAAGTAVAAWEQRRDACREILIELAHTQHVEHLQASGGSVEIKQVRSLTMPRPGTPQRDELTEIIRQANIWEAVASPIAPKLLKAMDDGLFTPEQAAKLSQVCPVGSTWRLAAKPKK